MPVRFFLGGYTADMDGRADGVGVVHAGAPDDVLAGGALRWAGTATAAASPSWIAWHPTLDVVYAAHEAAGTVQAYRRIGEEAFAPLGDPVPVGELVCHLAVAPDGRSLIASCYGDGRIVRVAVDAAGRPSAPVAAPAAAAAPVPVADLPNLTDVLGTGSTPHAHQARFTPAGLVTIELGLDLVRAWEVRGDALAERHRVALPVGTGPRHGVWHPSGHLYVVTEHSNEVSCCARSRRRVRLGRWHTAARHAGRRRLRRRDRPHPRLRAVCRRRHPWQQYARDRPRGR